MTTVFEKNKSYIYDTEEEIVMKKIPKIDKNYCIQPGDNTSIDIEKDFYVDGNEGYNKTSKASEYILYNNESLVFFKDKEKV